MRELIIVVLVIGLIAAAMIAADVGDVDDRNEESVADSEELASGTTGDATTDAGGQTESATGDGSATDAGPGTAPEAAASPAGDEEGDSTTVGEPETETDTGTTEESTSGYEGSSADAGTDTEAQPATELEGEGDPETGTEGNPETDTGPEPESDGQSGPEPAAEGGDGYFHLLISDKPADISDFDSLKVTLDYARVHAWAANESNASWEIFDLNGTQVELTNLVGNRSLPVLNGTLEAGNYTKIELYLEDVEGIVNGSEVDVKVPSGKLMICMNFTVVANQTIMFVFDMHVVLKGNGGYNLTPVITESGVVGEDLEDVVIVEE
jgi:hypothetical protein